MYHYFYDSFLNEKKFQPILAKTESRLMDLGINGKISKLSVLKDLDQIIINEVKQGVKTVVIVGNDKTIGEITNIIADLDVTIGIIPIGENNRIARLLGIPEGDSACDVLSARIVQKMDLGMINGSYFFTSLEFDGESANLNCDNNYFLSFDGKNNSITVNNLSIADSTPIKSNEGLFSIQIKHTQKGFFKSQTTNSFLKAQKISISGEGKSIPIFMTDEKKVIKTPAEVTIIPKKIDIIVGKSRLI